MTPPKLSRPRLLVGGAFIIIGIALFIDGMSSAQSGRPSWFFQNIIPETEWMWTLAAWFVGIIVIGGEVGWWIVRQIIFWWFHKTWREMNK